MVQQFISVSSAQIKIVAKQLFLSHPNALKMAKTPNVGLFECKRDRHKLDNTSKPCFFILIFCFQYICCVFSRKINIENTKSAKAG